jgi:chromosomal replication initiator protein
MSGNAQMIMEFPSRPEFAFSNYVVSESSRFAFEAAKNICSQTEVSYQTLYLFGGANLGKTHLLMSIGNHVAGHLPGQTALYIQGAEFAQKMGEGDSSAVQAVKRMEKVDVLLMDDVDQISGKKPAQEKLYYVYNALIEKQKKIVFAASVSPDKLSDTESYLKSRFQWGMTAELKPIDDASMIKIISKLGNDIDLALPEPIIEFLMNRIPRDFNSVKNAVEKINRESYLQKRKVSIPLAKAALGLT